MGLWAQLLRPNRYGATYSDIDNFWYNPAAWGPGGSGVSAPTTPETALRTSTVWACVSLLSRTQAMLPAIVYARRDDGGKDRNPTHRVARVFRKQPNAWQSPFEFRQYAMVCLLLRGNYYAREYWDGAGRLQALVPMPPDRVTVTQSPTTGRLGYAYRPLHSAPVALTQDDVFHVRGLSLDGVTGVSVIEYARQTFGRASAQEVASSSFYQNNMEVTSVLKGPPGQPMSEAAYKRLQQDLDKKRGSRNAGGTLILEQGFEFQKLGLTARDAQFIDTAYLTIEDICRVFGVQPHMVQHLLRATNNNIEQQSLEYVTYSLMPWNVAIESAAQRDLFADDDDHFLEFNVDMLLRGDTLSRAQAEAVWIQNGVYAENEVRIRENLNPWPGLWAPRRSANQDRGGDPNGARPGRAPAGVPRDAADGSDDESDSSTEGATAVEIVRGVAARLVRNEVAAVRAREARGGLDREWVAGFYGRHVDALMDALRLDVMQARQYGADHCALVLEQGVGVTGTWEQTAAPRLVAMALAPKENGHHVGA